MQKIIKHAFEGRISRLNFVMGQLLSLVAYSAVAGIFVFIARYIFNINDSSASVFANYPFLIMILVILFVPIFVYQASVFVKRLHDMNLQGILWLIIPGSTLVPPLGALIWILAPIFLALFKGSKGSNKFGVKPKGIRIF